MRLLAQAHDDERNDQPVQCDGFDEREPDPHVLADTALRFRLASHRFNHLAEDVADADAGARARR